MATRKRFLVNGRPQGGATDHAPYVHPALELLKALKSDMARTGRPQGMQHYRLADGTRLTALSRFGQDEIRIDIPRVPVLPVLPTRPEVLPEGKPNPRGGPDLFVNVLWGIMWVTYDAVEDRSFTLPVATARFGTVDDLAYLDEINRGHDPYGFGYAYLGAGETNQSQYEADWLAEYTYPPPPSLPVSCQVQFINGSGGGSVGSLPFWGSGAIACPASSNYVLTAIYSSDSNAWTTLPGIVPYNTVKAMYPAAVSQLNNFPFPLPK